MTKPLKFIMQNLTFLGKKIIISTCGNLQMYAGNNNLFFWSKIPFKSSHPIKKFAITPKICMLASLHFPYYSTMRSISLHLIIKNIYNNITP